jgi:hypothetical protein
MVSTPDKGATLPSNTMAVLDKSRFDVRMGPELTAQFEELSQTTGLTRAEIFRRALALYKRAKQVQMANGKVILEESGGSSVELIGL